MKQPLPTVLSNAYVVLQPISMQDASSYLEIGRDEKIWRYLMPEPFVSLADAERWVSSMLARAREDGSVTYSVYDKASGALAGSSSYLDVRVEHGGLEIGFTWYGTAFQRSRVNTATKLVLLDNAFEELGAHRVQLQTDRRNEASQRAIERLGAAKEGVLRKHKVYPNGYVRDSVMYSITSDDWPAVKSRLLGLLT